MAIEEAKKLVHDAWLSAGYAEEDLSKGNLREAGDEILEAINKLKKALEEIPEEYLLSSSFPEPTHRLPEEERVREVAMWTLDLLREKGPMTDKEISDQLDVPLERVSKATDKLMSEGKIEWEGLTGKYRFSYFPPKVVLTVETGIMRCRYCGAPYAYRENLEIHEAGCPRRTG